MKLIYLLSLLTTLPAFSAETFQCHSSAHSSFQASISGTHYRYQNRHFLSYELSVKEECHRLSCLPLTVGQYHFLESRREYKPTKYREHHQFILPIAVNHDRETIGDWQFILPYTTGLSFEAHLLLGLSHLNKGVSLTLQCEGNNDQSDGLPQLPPSQLLSDVFGINSDILYVNPKLLEIYQRGSSLSFQDALARALMSLLNDLDAPESPLAIAQFGVELDWRLPLGQSKIKDFILPRAYLKQEIDYGMLELANINFPPEGGESFEEDWIFTLQLPLSDHIYWAVVPKSGAKKAYNYGFN